ncbi:MAG TPA: exostosin domain-containing protein [Elainellaceae cyanobacterium]
MREMNRFNFLRLLKQARNYAHYLPGWIYYVQRTARRRFSHLLQGTAAQVTPMYDCPLGYGNQLDLPIRPIQDRPTDIFFAGSVEHRDGRSTIHDWISNPKSLARNTMLDNIEVLLEQRSDVSIDLAISSAFVLNALHYGKKIDGRVLDRTAYSESMMNAKICLIPRGTSPETFRFFEAIRYGCVLVTETLPSRWFYDRSPAIQVSNWDDMPEIVSQLLDDPSRLVTKQQEALKWWDEVCSPEAVGRYFAERINAQATR